LGIFARLSIFQYESFLLVTATLTVLVICAGVDSKQRWKHFQSTSWCSTVSTENAATNIELINISVESCNSVRSALWRPGCYTVMVDSWQSKGADSFQQSQVL